MKKLFCIMLIFALLLTLCACSAQPGAAATPAQVVLPSAAPEGENIPQFSVIPQETFAAAPDIPESIGITLNEADGVAYSRGQVLFPDGADEQSAVFSLDYSLPTFAESFAGAAAANAAIEEYKEEITARAAEEYLPFADGDSAAYARITSSTARVGDKINVLISEAVSFGEDNEETSLYAIVLDQNGQRLSLAAAAAVYEAEPLAAQQIFNQIGSAPEAYNVYGDITVNDIAAAVDIYSGFYAADNGYGIIIPAGAIAPEEQGPLIFVISAAAFYPACVGDVITAAEYARLYPALNALSAACALDYSDFAADSPAPYAASAFMTRIMTSGKEGTAFVAVDKAEYEQTYAAYFGTAVPQSIYDAQGDGTYADAQSIMIPVYPHAEHIFRIDDAAADGDTITFYGMICSGTPGTADVHELTAASISVARQQNSACGFLLIELQLR